MMAVGRKRKQGERTSSGRLTRSLREEIGGYPPTSIRRIADAAMRGMVDKEWGTPLGRMYLQGNLTGLQYEAGRRWDNLSRLYTQALAAPSPHPKPVAIGLAQRSAETDPDSQEGRSEARRHRQTIDAWSGASQAMMTAGPLYHAVVRATCEHHKEPAGEIEREALKVGLDALALHWQLTNENMERHK